MQSIDDSRFAGQPSDDALSIKQPIDDSQKTPSNSQEDPAAQTDSWALRVISPNETSIEFPIRQSAGSVSIGRAQDNDLVLDDPRTSRYHASIGISGNNLWLRDMGSRNMTFLNGMPLMGTMMLNNDDQIGLGRTLIIVCKQAN